MLLASVPITLFSFGCGDDTGTGGTTSNGGSGGNVTTASMTTASGANGGAGGTTTSTGGGGSTPTGDFDCTAAVGTRPPLKLTLVDDAVDFPILVKAAPDNPDRLYIVSRAGEIFIHQNGALVTDPFLDVSSKIRTGGGEGSEEGLLGLAFHPDYATNGRFFIHYSASGNGASTIEEYVRSADPLKATETPIRIALQHPTAQGNHNGGSIEFGKDNFLYIALGDGGNQGDPECDAQDPANLLGKIMRIDVNGTANDQGYPAAAGNPNGQKWYHIGFRNPWRMSFDACTGDLHIGDVGQGTIEEISVAPVDAGPLNFGWPACEGNLDHSCGGTADCSCGGGADFDTCPNPATPGPFTFPVASHDHGDGYCSMVGGYSYRGTGIPGLRGTYFYGDACNRTIWAIPPGGMPEDLSADIPLPADGFNYGVVSFGQDGRGNVYVVTLSGAIYRIEAE